MFLFGSNIYIQLFLLHVKITILKGYSEPSETSKMEHLSR